MRVVCSPVLVFFWLGLCVRPPDHLGVLFGFQGRKSSDQAVSAQIS